MMRKRRREQRTRTLPPGHRRNEPVFKKEEGCYLKDGVVTMTKRGREKRNGTSGEGGEEKKKQEGGMRLVGGEEGGQDPHRSRRRIFMFQRSETLGGVMLRRALSTATLTRLQHSAPRVYTAFSPCPLLIPTLDHNQLSSPRLHSRPASHYQLLPTL